MWGSLRSGSGFSPGETPQTFSALSTSQNDTSSIFQVQAQGSPSVRIGGSGGTSVGVGRSRGSITSLLSSTIMSSSVVSSSTNAETTGVGGFEHDQDTETFTYIDTFFDRFWSEMSVFAFERAKEIADKEKEQALKSHNGNNCASSGFTWVILTTAMAQVAMTEKGYMNFTYLAPKGFLRKDSNLKTMLESIRLDLKKIMDSGAPSSPFRHKNLQIAACLTVLINLRLEQMEFYDRLSVFGTSKNVEICDLISDIEIIYEKFKAEVNAAGSAASILDGILNILQWESETLISLLKSVSMMQTWEYLDATIALQRANSQILEWTEILQSHSTTLKKSSFYNSPPNYPLLFLWIKKLKGALVSKYSLYFNELLVKNSNSSFDIKSYCSKLPVDYFGKMLSFQKKSDALCVCIIFDAKDTKYHPNGYNCIGKEVRLPTGLETFPAVLSIPTKPTIHWPNVVMIISGRLNELNVDKLVGFYDSSMQATYFVQRIDPKMFLVAIYESKKSEKDAYTAKFMMEITMDLKCGKIFSALKTTK